MRIGIPKESLAGETRVACTPATVAQLLKLGFEVVVEHDAGAGASLNDAAYAAAGAQAADFRLIRRVYFINQRAGR